MTRKRGPRFAACGRMALLASFALGLSAGSVHAQAEGGSRFAGLYGGIEAGPVSYGTRITFDGVVDPAGRGGSVYGAFLGHGVRVDGWMTGVEVAIHAASVPDPYTFDAGVTGFATLDLRRERAVGLDVRAGRILHDRALVYGIVGYSIATQSVRLDGVPLSEHSGGSGPRRFGAVHVGVGIDVPLMSRLGLRFTLRRLGGHDLTLEDLGRLAPSPTLTFFDVEPRQVQFLLGLRYGV